MLTKSYGEFNLIHRILERIQVTSPDVVIGPGDDTAAVRTTPDMLTLMSTDTFVEGLDFTKDYSTWTQIGWKSMAANVSDIAAMGGLPKYALVTFCLPEDLRIEAVDNLCDGMADLAQRFGVLIVGGDLSGTPGPVTISVTITGEIPPHQLIKRSGAQVGDRICVTGHLGGAEAGLRLLMQSLNHPSHNLSAALDSVARHRTPIPRVQEARLLAESGHVHSMIDISDGLSADVLHIGEDSGAGIVLYADALPVDPATLEAARALQDDPIQLAMNSGEEFELVCTVSEKETDGLCRRITDATGTPMTVIGEVVPSDSGNTWRDESGTHALVSGGYDHF